MVSAAQTNLNLNKLLASFDELEYLMNSLAEKFYKDDSLAEIQEEIDAFVKEVIVINAPRKTLLPYLITSNPGAIIITVTRVTLSFLPQN